MKKAALHNLGCKVNSYETEAMQQMLEHAGYEIVPFFEKADVYVINTCSVTNMADKKSRQMLHRARKLNPEAIVVATGCYVQTIENARTGENTADHDDVMKDIDIIIGNNKKHELIELLERYEAAEPRNEAGRHQDSDARSCDSGNSVFEDEIADRLHIESVIDINDGKQGYEELSLEKTGEHTRAFIKVQDGCNQFCSYCIIPYARGRVRSRKLSDVVNEIEQLASRGYKETVLTGIHLSSYGIDTGESLIELIESVAAIEGIERIRLGSLEPRVVTDEFAKRLASIPKICPHFHLSLQSGCDEVLLRMNRKYNTAQYREGCETLRRYFKNPAITTDVIVGFPAETDEEFEITRSFLREIRFYEMHIFKYSKRQGTRAAVMPDQVAEQVKHKRSAALISLAEEMSHNYRERFIGENIEVLIEETVDISGEKYYVGYTPEYVKAAFKVSDATGQYAGDGGISPINTILRGTAAGFLEEGTINVNWDLG